MTPPGLSLLTPTGVVTADSFEISGSGAPLELPDPHEIKLQASSADEKTDRIRTLFSCTTIIKPSFCYK